MKNDTGKQDKKFASNSLPEHLYSRMERYITCGLVLLLLILTVAIVILGSVPPVDRDALTHHLFVPKLWIRHGGIFEIPGISFSYYPMNLDLLYTIPLYFDNDIIPKYIHHLFALLTGLLLHRHLKHRLGGFYGLFGTLFFLSIPIIIKLSITVYVDLGVVFFTTAALLLLLHWAEKDFQWRFLIFSGLCCGLAAGTKYNGLIGIVVLTLLVPLIYQQTILNEKKSNKKALLSCFVFALAALVSFSPWLIRNFAWTGNPIYPLHNSLFQKFSTTNDHSQHTVIARNLDSSQQNNPKARNAFISRKLLYDEPWWLAMFLPVRYFFEGQDDSPQFFDGKLTPFLLFLPILAFLIRSPDTRQRREQRFLLLFATLYFFFTFFQEELRIRYIVPIVPPLIILSMHGLRSLFWVISKKQNVMLCRYGRVLAASIPLFMLVYNAEYLAQQFQKINPLPYLRGELNRDQYISHFRPEYPAIQFTNTLPEQSRILAVFLGNRGYYFDKPVDFDMKEGGSMLYNVIRQVRTEKQASELLKKQNISHLLIRLDLFTQWIEQQPEPVAKERLKFFLQTETRLLFEKNGHGVFQLI